MHTPFFSVIIPAYNRGHILSTAIHSVLTQSFNDLELIIIDDGSTDNTKQLVNSLEDARVKYFYQENRERSASRNRGIEMASGKYLCLLDSDDHFYTDHLEVLYKAIIKDNSPVAVYKTMMHYGDNSRPDDFSYAYNGDSRNDAIKYVWKNASQLICLSFHNSIGRNVQFSEEYFWFEDIHWLMRVVMKYPLKQIMAHTTYYFKSDNHFSIKGYEKYLVNGESCIRDLEKMHGDELKKILGPKCFDIKVSELYLGLVVNNAANSKMPRLGSTYLLKAIRTCITPKLFIKYCYYSLKLLKASLVR